MAFEQQRVGSFNYGFDGTQWYRDEGESGWVPWPSKPAGWVDTAQTQAATTAAQQAATMAAQQAAQQQSALQTGLANGSISVIPDETGGAPTYKQINPDGTVSILNASGMSQGSYTPSFSGGGMLGDIFGGLKSAVNSVASDPILSLAAAAMTGGALSNAGLLSGAAPYTGSGLTAASAGAGTGLQAGGTIGLGAGSIGTAAATDAALSSLAPSLAVPELGATAAGLTAASALPSLGTTTAVPALGTGTSLPGLSAVPTTTPSSIYDLNALTSGIGSGLGGLTSGIGSNLGNLTSGINSGLDTLGSGLGNLTSGIGSGLNTLTGGLSNGLSSLSSNLGNILSQNGLLSTAATTAGAALNAEAAKQAAQTQADAQIRAAQIAADAAKFKPVGVTTGFGSSQFGFDANGNLTSAGYNLTPEMQAQRDALLASSNGLMGQFTGSQAATAPMATAAQQAMTLGNQYLATDPQAQAAKYYADQMKLLEPGRADALAQLQAQMQAQGRGGFAIGGGVGGQGAANPQLQALYNAQLQQNNQLAANATQGGMDYAKFGAGLVGTGGDLLSSMYGTQTAAFNPYKTALGGAQTVEGLGQNALTLGMDMGKTATAANTTAGGLLASGMTNAASTMAPANAYSPWGALLSGAGSTLSGYKFDPMTGKAL